MSVHQAESFSDRDSAKVHGLFRAGLLKKVTMKFNTAKNAGKKSFDLSAGRNSDYPEPFLDFEGGDSIHEASVSDMESEVDNIVSGQQPNDMHSNNIQITGI